jgi:hypothetical protein
MGLIVSSGLLFGCAYIMPQTEVLEEEAKIDVKKHMAFPLYFVVTQVKQTAVDKEEKLNIIKIAALRCTICHC